MPVKKPRQKSTGYPQLLTTHAPLFQGCNGERCERSPGLAGSLESSSKESNGQGKGKSPGTKTEQATLENAVQKGVPPTGKETGKGVGGKQGKRLKWQEVKKRGRGEETFHWTQPGKSKQPVLAWGRKSERKRTPRPPLPYMAQLTLHRPPARSPNSSSAARPRSLARSASAAPLAFIQPSRRSQEWAAPAGGMNEATKQHAGGGGAGGTIAAPSQAAANARFAHERGF